MQYDANIYTEPPSSTVESLPAAVNELSSVASRQIADAGEISTRLYSFLLAAERSYPLGSPVWVEHGSDVFVAYPVIQKGKNLRMHRRDGEFWPGIVLERLGAYERGGGLLVTGGNGWFVTEDDPNVYYTQDFSVYEDVQTLRNKLNGPVLLKGDMLLLGSFDAFYTSTDGINWTQRAVAGAAEVWSLAWDGLKVWVAGEGGVYQYDLAADTSALTDAGAWHGLSYAFMNFNLFRAKFNGAGGYDLFDRVGNPFRTIAFNVFQLAHNWVVAGDYHYVTALDGSVHRFDAATDTDVGQIAQQGRSAATGQATFLLRDQVFAVGYGQLVQVTDDGLRVVYDFGQDVRAYPTLGGFTVVREDGLVYRVRRVNVGAN